MSDVSVLLNAMSSGDPDARTELLPLVYAELRNIAKRQMRRERSDHTLEATALVHEAYLRLLGNDTTHFGSRAHFFGAAAEAMRRILIDHARKKQAQKNGGGHARIDGVEEIPDIRAPQGNLNELLSLDDVLDRFSKESPEGADLVKLLYFAGLSLEEAGDVLGLSRSTTYRRWQFARAWLFRALSEKDKPS